MPPTRRAPVNDLSELSAEDAVLIEFGPWDSRSGLAGEDKVLWHPRCDTRRLYALWLAHGGQWAESRLRWCLASCAKTSTADSLVLADAAST